MINQLNSHPIHSDYHPEIYQTALRRRLQSELSEIKDLLKENPFEDQMTKQISLWHKNFFQSMRLQVDVKAIHGEFIRLLQELLIDPISHAPLDEEALLGNDGHTYSMMSLTLYTHSVPDQFKDKSPINPQNPLPFSTSPHPVVKHMINWLKNHNSLLPSEEIKSAYMLLMNQKRAEGSSDRIRRIQRIKEKQKQRDLDKNDNSLKLELEQTTAEFAQKIHDQFMPLHQQIKDSATSHFSRLQTLEQSDREDRERVNQLHLGAQALENQNRELERRIENVNKMIDRRLRVQRLMEREVQRIQDRALEDEALNQELLRLQNEGAHEIEQVRLSSHIWVQNNEARMMARIQSIQTNDQQNIKIIQERIDQLNKDVEEIERENQQLKVQINRIDQSIKEAEREDAELQIAINEVKESIKNGQSSWLSSILVTVAVIGACAFATWAMQGALSAMGPSGTLIPLEGGAKLSIAIAF